MTKILIVEDDPMISEIYQKKFSEAGFDVAIAESGEQAINAVKKEKIDLMLLDLIMPKMDGFEVIKNVRNMGYGDELKIYVFSNLSQRDDQDKAMKLGANGFIIKSDYAPSDLVKEVSRIISQNKEEEKNVALHNNNEKVNENASEKKKILLIEDEEVFLDMFGEKLRQDGYEVETANNGAWGFKEAMGKKFDIYIVDMVMPAMTGEEIIKKLKLEEETKNIPIIALSASVEDHVEDRVRELGVNEFFVKTRIIPSELSRKVEELIG